MGSRIVRLEVNNIKRISAVDITPDGSMVVLGGENGQGKSSILDAITCALGGKKFYPPRPVKKGQKKGTIVLHLDDLKITRTITASGGGSIKIEYADGREVRKEQSILDRLTGKMVGAMDFASASKKKQIEVMKGLTDLDFGPLAARYKAAFDSRTDINRLAKDRRSQAEAIIVHASAPTEETSVAGLSRELEAAHSTQRVAMSAAKDADDAKDDEAQERVRFDGLKRQLDESAIRIGKLKLETQRADEQAFAAAQATVDPDPIRARIDAAEETNATVRSNARRHELTLEADAHDAESAKLTHELDNIDTEKAALLGSVTLPVEGLEFDEDDIRFNGQPLEQASQAEKIRISVSVALAGKPELAIVLVRDGSHLDAGGMKLVRQIADENDAQTWVERVGVSDDGAIVIEDGMVKA